MSSASTSPTLVTARQVAKRLVNSALQIHIPVGGLSRPVFAFFYHGHVACRAILLWVARFCWYEPLFRSQCQSIGPRFRMEQLPYLVGRGTILIGSDVQLSGKPSLAFSSRHCADPQLLIGDGTFLGHNTALLIAKRVTIGRHCLIAGGVRMSDFDGHPLDAVQRRAGDFVAPERVQPIAIGDDVWIGHGATILKGVTIGDRCIIGACAVVTHSLPSDCIAAGNPARIVGHLLTSTLDIPGPAVSPQAIQA